MTTQTLHSPFAPKGINSGQKNRRSDNSSKSLWTSLVAYFEKKLTRWLENRERRAALEHLTTLDDRLLADIGVSRAEVYARLEKPYEDAASWPPKAPSPF